MQYKNIVLVFPTIALLSENYERLLTDDNYDYFYDEFTIHTLSEINGDKIGHKNIFIFTPERYLSFIDKNRKLDIDFVFVDEIYKIDNEYLTNTINKENERDTAYRVALFHILKSTHDILLVGPYIEFPDTNESTTNQSFNLFLYNNNFTILDFNKYEIVNKSVSIINNGITKIDNNLSIDLKGYKKVGEKLGKIVSDIRQIEENCIIYTKGAGTAEKKTKDIIKFSNASDTLINNNLQQLITHLKRTFKLEDWSLIRGLENKIGIHHGLVPKYIQKEIIQLFNEGNLDVLISTTTITEGVNTSAKNLIVQSASKGNKPLKTFDAKNIAGRAGRFLHHYQGRVLIIDKKFKDILEGSDSEIKHKNYDESSKKDEIDYFITNEDFLNSDDRKSRKLVLHEQLKRDIPNEIMQMYKVISHSDKITVYDKIIDLSHKDHLKIKQFIQKISYLYLDRDGFSVILNTIYPIINNKKLLFFIDTESQIKKGQNIGKIYPILTYMLSAYLSGGFMGSVTYNLSRQKKTSKGNRNLTTDEAIRDSSSFIFHTLKYQLVKYLGVFNMMYKFIISKQVDKLFDDVLGIDKLLMKLEYNAVSAKGRLASDYGVPSKIIKYYDNDNQVTIRETFDEYEESKFKIIESILNR